TAKVNAGLDVLDTLVHINHLKMGSVEEQIKYRAFELLTSIFITISATMPLVLFLDDVQWADPLSLEFLAYFIRNTEGHRIFVLCTARNQEIRDETKSIQTWLLRISRYNNFNQIKLDPLSNTEVRTLTNSIFGN